MIVIPTERLDLILTLTLIAGPISDTENPSEDQLSSVATPKGYTLTKVKAEVVASTCMSVTPSSSCHHPVDVDDLACPHAEDNPLSP